jgi:hypothetical protein
MRQLVGIGGVDDVNVRVELEPTRGDVLVVVQHSELES